MFRIRSPLRFENSITTTHHYVLSKWETEFVRAGIMASMKAMNAKIIVYNVDTKKIEQWITYNQK